ncbi:hypothetical protein DYB37_008844 [Aphanomyces astaci]|uniref:Uncharacterized protein n=1 Tax=Aphanomyces astaci TaxID=112090 RepID=A0A3R7A981_APHAT|nr:hypothetical protein DYB35_006227 [Aphanomyces astaci]RHZ25976.1 hypothetical protein DYB37_008844 [Aphanomyces astaci]
MATDDFEAALEHGFNHIDEKVELIIDAQDARFRRLEEDLNAWNRRLDSMEQEIVRLPERVCSMMLQHVDALPADFHTVMATLTESVLQSLRTLNDAGPPPPAPMAADEPTFAVLTDDHGMDMNESPPHGHPRPPDDVDAVDTRPKKRRRKPRPKKPPHIPEHDYFPSHLDRVTPVHEHVWADGITRRTPEAWRFPNSQVRLLWAYWFRGDEPNQIGPYRLLNGLDFGTRLACRSSLSHTRVLMKMLVGLAIEHGFATSEDAIADMSLKDTMLTFDKAFIEFQKVHPTMTSSSHSLGVLYSRLPRRRRKQPEGLNASLHVWADGSDRMQVPDGWAFPNTTCRVMWPWWFLGSPDIQIGPYRRLRTMDFTTPESKDLLMQARMAMHELALVAVANQWAESEDAMEELPHDTLMDIFDKCYFILMHRNPKGNLAGPGRLERSTVHSLSIRTVAKAIRRARKLPINPPTKVFEWADGTRRQTPEEWRFPKEMTARELWARWFLGEPDTQVGPFRLVATLDVKDFDSRVYFSRAKFLLQDLVEIAKRKHFADSADAIAALPEDACMAVFDQTYHALFHDNPLGYGNIGGTAHGLLRPKRGPLYMWKTVRECIRKLKKLHQENAADDVQAAVAQDTHNNDGDHQQTRDMELE